MRDKRMSRFSTYESFHVDLNGYKIADIVLTDHALSRWDERVETGMGSVEQICSYLWDKLKLNRVQPYYPNEHDVLLIENDLVMVAEFKELKGETDIAGNPLHKMIVITFLGRISEEIELRDLKSYYAWLRHTRRMTLVKNVRKRK